MRTINIGIYMHHVTRSYKKIQNGSLTWSKRDKYLYLEDNKSLLISSSSEYIFIKTDINRVYRIRKNISMV